MKERDPCKQRKRQIEKETGKHRSDREKIRERKTVWKGGADRLKRRDGQTGKEGQTD